MGVSKKGKRKVVVDGKTFWWFVRENAWGEPYACIVADDHSFEGRCNLYCPVLHIAKDGEAGARSIPVPSKLANDHPSFTSGYIAGLIRLSAAHG